MFIVGNQKDWEFRFRFESVLDIDIYHLEIVGKDNVEHNCSM